LKLICKRYKRKIETENEKESEQKKRESQSLGRPGTNQPSKPAQQGKSQPSSPQNSLPPFLSKYFSFLPPTGGTCL
jgi:hypothetical protein